MYGNYAPKTNISRAYYRKIVDKIEHDPLIKHSTLSLACFTAVIAVLLGGIIWFAKLNPGNLIQTSGTITGISTGLTDDIGTITTFVTFDFTTREGEQKSARARTHSGVEYKVGHSIRAGYYPKNPNYARNLSDNRPPQPSIYLWSVPFLIMIWLIFVALFRYSKRQQAIWDAAEASYPEPEDISEED